MKKTLCFYFQIHLPYQLRRYRFFDIGNSHQYYDEFHIRTYLNKIVEQCYLPMNKVLLDTIKEYGSKFKVSFSITGETIEQLKKYAPHALDSFIELSKTGSVEFICETYAHSLAFLKNEEELERQLLKQAETIKKYFNQTPKTVRLTGLLYSDQIGEMVAKLGFETMLTEGAKHVLGWKSPNYVYTNANNSKLNVLLRNFNLSDDIAYHFSDRTWSEWPVTSEKFVNWLDDVNEKEEVVNLFMDYITFGNRHSQSSGIFEFMRFLPKEVYSHDKFEFLTPSEVVKKHKPIGVIHVPYPISWSEEERDLSIWLGNDLQKDAFETLTNLGEKIRFIDDDLLTQDWERLQDSDHYYYMCTKWMSDTSTRRFKTPEIGPYDAYINYMNVLSDLISRVDEEIIDRISLLKKDKNYSRKIAKLVKNKGEEYTSFEIKQLRMKIEEIDENILLEK